MPRLQIKELQSRAHALRVERDTMISRLAKIADHITAAEAHEREVAADLVHADFAQARPDRVAQLLGGNTVGPSEKELRIMAEELALAHAKHAHAKADVAALRQAHGAVTDRISRLSDQISQADAEVLAGMLDVLLDRYHARARDLIVQVAHPLRLVVGALDKLGARDGRYETARIVLNRMSLAAEASGRAARILESSATTWFTGGFPVRTNLPVDVAAAIEGDSDAQLASLRSELAKDDAERSPHEP